MNTSVTVRPRSLNYYCVANTFTGHGRVAIELATHMMLRGIQLNWFPLCYGERDENVIPQCFKDQFQHKVIGPGFMWASYDHTVDPNWNGSLRYIVHETERVPRAAIDMYRNTNCALATPTKWNANVLRRSGWKGRIHIVPHGISSMFKYSPPTTSPFVFGCAVRYGSTAARRKNIDQLIRCFQAAFPHTHDDSIQLHIKSFPDDYEIDAKGDHRIKVVREFMSQERYMEWLKKITVYVNISSGEGWCMPMHEALAVGRPAITPFHGGLTEYVNDKCCYLIPYRKRKPVSGFYKGQMMIECVSSYVIEAMRHCVTNIQDVIVKGVAGTQRAHMYSWNTAGTKLFNALTQEGLIK